MTLWWERYRSVLEREEAALEAARIGFERDPHAYQAGVLQLRLTYPWKGGAIALTARYPDLYPYFRPEVSSDDFRLSRHQNPITGNLCLINRPTSRWFVEETLAKLLTDSLPELLRFRDTGDLAALAKVEEPQGEPTSEYYNNDSIPGSLVLFDGDWELPADIARGRFRAALKEVGSYQGAPVYRGYVSEVQDEQGARLAHWDGPRPDGHHAVEGRWLRLDRPFLGKLEALLKSLDPADRAFLENKQRWGPGRHVALAAVVFPEEIRPGTTADGWAAFEFVVLRKKKGDPHRSTAYAFLRTERGGASDLAARMPAVRSLPGRSVLLVGTGAIGAPIALELARAGLGRLALVDGDTVGAANVRRWPLGWRAMGEQKVSALKQHLAEHYPGCHVRIESEKVGNPFRPPQARSQWDLLDDLIADADLVIDATAEMGVNHFLADRSRAAGKPFLLANATPGSWGGMVAQFRQPQDQGCWMCMRRSLYGDDATILLPPADPAGEVQPPGCAEITFTGADFDLQEVSLQAVRAAVGLLAPDYPAHTGGLQILRARGSEHAPPLPAWESHTIPRFDDCPTCAKTP